VETGQIQMLLDHLSIELVLTAHPTEARRRTAISKIQHVAHLLDQISSDRFTPRERETTRAAIHAEISSLWLTDRDRMVQPAVTDEVRTGLYFVDNIFWDALPGIYEDLERALADFERSLKINPQFVKGYIGRGMARLDMGETKAAFEDYDHAVGLAPRDAETLYHRGDARLRAGDVAGALADFENAMKLDPKLASSYLGRGTVRFYEKDYDGAIKDFTAALNLDGRLSLAYRNRGFVYLAEGQDAGAEKDFSRAVTLTPRLGPGIDATVKIIKRLRK